MVEKMGEDEGKQMLFDFINYVIKRVLLCLTRLI